MRFRHSLALLVFAVLFLGASDFDSMLYPMVRVKTEIAGGSGTIIYSADRSTTGSFETFVLTNHHVVDDAIKVEDRWDSLLNRMRKVEETKTVTVECFAYEPNGFPTGRTGCAARELGFRWPTARRGGSDGGHRGMPTCPMRH